MQSSTASNYPMIPLQQKPKGIEKKTYSVSMPRPKKKNESSTSLISALSSKDSVKKTNRIRWSDSENSYDPSKSSNATILASDTLLEKGGTKESSKLETSF
jgi:hypothetical protein